MFDSKIYGVNEFLNPLLELDFILCDSRSELTYSDEQKLLTVKYSERNLTTTIQSQNSTVFMAKFNYDSIAKARILENIKYLASATI